MCQLCLVSCHECFVEKFKEQSEAHDAGAALRIASGYIRLGMLEICIHNTFAATRYELLPSIGLLFWSCVTPIFTRWHGVEIEQAWRDRYIKSKGIKDVEYSKVSDPCNGI